MASKLAATSDAVILIPGIMGSELVNAEGAVVWGLKPSLLLRQLALRDVFKRLTPTPNDGIRARRLLQFPAALPLVSALEPYSGMERALSRIVVEPTAFLSFPYDWRLSVVDSARHLATVAREHLSRWRARWAELGPDERRGLPDPKLSLVCHSMGGLVASHFAAFDDGGGDVQRIITLGTPFLGSLNAVQVLATGDQLQFGLFATALRDAARRMPSLYELIARWACVDEGGNMRNLTPADMQNVGANPTLAAQATDVVSKIYDALSGKVGRKPPIRCMVGTTQPTRQSVRLEHGAATFMESLGGTDYRGDGTVFRMSATAPGIAPSYLPQTHGGVAKVNESFAFVQAVLTERELGQFQGAAGVGLRCPDLVLHGQDFSVEILDAERDVVCRLVDTESEELISVKNPEMQDGALIARFHPPHPGLFRVVTDNGGFSPVESLVSVVAKD